MPRYFFHIRDGTETPDLDGTVLPDAESARVEAVRLCGGLLKDLGHAFWTGKDWHLTVVDESDARVCLITVSGQRF